MVGDIGTNEEIGVKYMQAWEEKYYEHEEGWKEGLEEGRKEGHREGLEEGRKEGVEEGKKEGQRETLRLMEEKLSGGSRTPEIERALEEIRRLMKELEKSEDPKKV